MPRRGLFRIKASIFWQNQLLLSGCPGGARSHDIQINSLALYQLSYRAINEGLGLKPRRTPTNFGFGSPSQTRTRSTAVKALRATITQRDYKSAPQRYTGTGLLFSSRVLRVLLKRNTSRSYSFGFTLGNYKRNDPFTSLSLVYRFPLFLATYQAAPRPWAAPHLPVVV